MSNTLPLEKQSKRVHSGLMPTFFYRFTMSYPNDTTEITTYYCKDYKDPNNADKICGELTVVYTDNTKTRIASVTNPYARDAQP